MKKYLAIAVIPLVAACSVVDPFYGTEEGTVVSVDNEDGCSVTFRLEGSEASYISVAKTLRENDRCTRLEKDMSVPVVADPIYGDYPYILFEEMSE